MADNQVVHEIDIGAIHLFQREGVIQVQLFVADDTQLPLHQLGGDPLGLRHLRAAEAGKFREAPSSELDSRAAIVVREGG